MKGFARREFQLMLLRRMADFQPELVADACAALGASHTQYMAAHNRWQSMLISTRAPRGLGLYQAALGPPDTERAVLHGDVTVTACTWHLPGLWRDLRWEAMVGENGVVLHGWLVRAADARAPKLPAPDLMKPWSCVVGDVLTQFPTARQANPDVPSQWLVHLNTREGLSWQLWFVYGLLQTARTDGSVVKLAG
ncbi:MAG TPA: hypothetical protein DGG94_01975 [Micromonosporaceae bacterium]|nr:hypothetical protein [Micromonosporaceae bacterium]HCU48593.1 hypothetical protein [Micromonosporaceae bacterium]